MQKISLMAANWHVHGYKDPWWRVFWQPILWIGPHWLTMPGLGKGKQGNIPMMSSHFTQYAQAYITWSQTTQIMAKALWGNFTVHYALLEKTLFNQGRNFMSKLIADLCRLTGTKKPRISPYYSQTNGECERFNSTLISMLVTLPWELKFHWKSRVRILVHVYICTWTSSIGFSPYFCCMEDTPWFPIDVLFGITSMSVSEPTSSKYIQKLRDHIKCVHKKVNLFHWKKVQCHKWNYNWHSRQCPWSQETWF